MIMVLKHSNKKKEQEWAVYFWWKLIPAISNFAMETENFEICI